MGAVARIVELLRLDPDLKFRVGVGTVTVEPRTADGFPVSLTEGTDGWVVTFGVEFGGWHEHFTSEDEALDRFAFGLSDRCRLRVRYRGACPYRWTLEERTESGWRVVGTTSQRVVSFWRRPRDEYHQNAVFRGAEPSAPPDPVS